jgi:hypothetical protein
LDVKHLSNVDDGTEAYRNRHILGEVFETDIILTLEQARAILEEAKIGNVKGGRYKRQAEPNPKSFWRSLTVPYRFAVSDGSSILIDY